MTLQSSQVSKDDNYQLKTPLQICYCVHTNYSQHCVALANDFFAEFILCLNMTSGTQSYEFTSISSTASVRQPIPNAVECACAYRKCLEFATIHVLDVKQLLSAIHCLMTRQSMLS